MNTSTYKGKKRVYLGVRLHCDGKREATFFQKTDINNAMTAPVHWLGAVAELYFWNYIRGDINRDASDLITHPGFNIRGPALIVTGNVRWHHFYVAGTEEHVRARLRNIEHTYADEVIFRPGGRHQTHQNIYVKNENDAFAIRTAL